MSKATIELDEQTYRSLEFAARIGNTTPGEVVARLVAAASMPQAAATPSSEDAKGGRKDAVYVDYAGHRTHGIYDRETTRIDVTSGPLTGQSFKTPTSAAAAVIQRYKSGVSPNRNGWSFWRLDDGSGNFLQTIRHA